MARPPAWHPLQARIAGMGTNMTQAMAGYHPAGTAATPMVMPMAKVTYYPNQVYPSATLAYEVLPVMWAPDGAALPGQAPYGTWANLHAAGRSSPAHQ